MVHGPGSTGAEAMGRRDRGAEAALLWAEWGRASLGGGSLVPQSLLRP